MDNALGRPAEKALQAAPDREKIRIVETAAPQRNGETRREGTLRVLCCRGNTWVAARFLDGAPRRKEIE